MNNRMKVALTATAVMLLASPVISVGVTSPSNVQTAQAATADQVPAIQSAILNELNNLRAQNGLSPVTEVSPLVNLAANRASHLSAMGALDHHAGYNYKDGAPYTAVAGENIGYWYNSSITDPTEIAKQIITNLYDDNGIATFGHRKNMLNPYFTHVGIGVTINPSNGYIFYTQEFGTMSNEITANVNAVRNYSAYTGAIGLSSEFPTKFDPSISSSSTNSNTSSNSVYPGATKINAIITPVRLTTLYTSPAGKKSNRSIAGNTSWYTDQVFIDGQGNHWYRVSTSEWAEVNDGNLQNL
ncbi:CAP domain-containing protein [Companilactobacillus mishanensis]|uniref:CAP domain-containing protein n=1 Tax=Companilactobacillus mishanensis TaxID=2486008 RepID=A0ABW9P3U1_9LACO|nr:CAP domain-containing protein [Companilactobacillus mishanensis]MQS43871.1 CAP domain-containing protein [Companilactobacillus mishanensis]